jgi:serine/threonine-protein kinase RsbW
MNAQPHSDHTAGSGDAPQRESPADAEKVTLTLDRDADRQAAFQDELLETAARFGYDESARFAIRLAVEEATVNAFRHGAKGRDDATIDIVYTVTAKRIVITVNDHGEGFEPGDVPDPTQEDRIDLPTGRGLLIMRAFMTDVRYNDVGNTVTMTYEKPNGVVES